MDYAVESENDFIDQLDGSFMIDPWDAINSGADASEFFNLELDELNSTYILRIESEGGDNEIKINTQILHHWLVDFGAFLELVDSIFDRITGKDIGGIWPVDISVGIAESYPEQFRVDVIFRRGLDTYTYTGAPATKFALIVSDTYDTETSFEPNWIFNATTIIWGNITLVNSGDQIKYNFPMFTFGTETDFDNLGFMVLLQSGTYLKSHPQEGDLPFVGTVDPRVYDDLTHFFPQTTTYIDTFPSVPAFLPFPWFMSIISIIAIPIIRSKRN